MDARIPLLDGEPVGQITWPVPTRCPRCDNEEVRYVAMIPARVLYECVRAQQRRCPLCAKPAPIRARP